MLNLRSTINNIRLIYQNIIYQKKLRKKSLAVLIDPEINKINRIEEVLRLSLENHVDYLFVGGSLLVEEDMDHCLQRLTQQSQIPVILFPGNKNQINAKADGILLLSLISGRNPDLLIGQHVEAAPALKRSRLEILPTGYMLVESGSFTTAHYISNTLPIPSHKPEIAACTAMAGEMLGLKLIYLDGGSGAGHAVPAALINAVSRAVDIPVIVGGGIRSGEQLQASFEAGADIAVIGNAVEENPALISKFSLIARTFSTSVTTK